MWPHCLPTIRTFRGIPHHSRLNPRTFPGLFADNPQTVVVLSGESVNRTLFPRLTRIVRRNGVIHFGNVSWSCPCSSGRQALLGTYCDQRFGFQYVSCVVHRFLPKRRQYFEESVPNICIQLYGVYCDRWIDKCNQLSIICMQRTDTLA